MNYRLASGLVDRYEKAQKYYRIIDGDLPFINTYQILALTSGSYILFGIGCFDSESKAIQKTLIKHRELYKEDRPHISFARIKKVVKGYLPIRNIDIAKEYKPINWNV